MNDINAETYLLLELLMNLGVVNVDFGDTLWDEAIGVYWNVKYVK
jgi:hypothetical protein